MIIFRTCSLEAEQDRQQCLRRKRITILLNQLRHWLPLASVTKTALTVQATRYHSRGAKRPGKHSKAKRGGVVHDTDATLIKSLPIIEDEWLGAAW